MRRKILGTVVGAVLGLSASIGVSLAAGGEDDLPSVPAADCPDAVAVFEDAGKPVPDYFSPGCPDPDSIQFDTVMSPGLTLYAHEACVKFYEVDPGWCPSDQQVDAAKAATEEER